jgi:hypothetical protein
MADLPMAQIPNFSLGATQIPYANPGEGLMRGAAAGGQLALNQQTVQQGQQALDMQKQQQTISQVDTLLKSGMNYPGMLPTFWPAIASRMNSLSPDYKLDPNNPPENLPNFAKQLSSISDGLSDKVVSPPQAHAATMQLIQSSYPSPAPADGGGGPQQSPTQSAGPQSAPPMQGQPQQTPMGQGAQPQQTPADPLSNFAAVKARFDSANQLISQAPMEGPQSQEVLRKQLAESSLGIEYKKALDQLATTANAQYGASQENARFDTEQHTQHVNAQQTLFKEQSLDNAGASTDYVNAITTLSNPLMQQNVNSLTPPQKQAVVQAERNAIIKAVQAETPASKRPVNFNAEEQLQSGGSAVSKWKSMWHQVTTGSPLTLDMLTGLRSQLVDGHLAVDADQTQKENSSAQLAQAQGVHPQEFIQNKRASPNFVSTSQYFPSKGTPSKPLVGEVRKGYKFLGGDGSNGNNWIPVATNGQ